MKTFHFVLICICTFLTFNCKNEPEFDILIKNGTIVNGSGKASFIGDIAINSDTIVSIGDLSEKTAVTEIDATGLVVAPGIINMLSWAASSLEADGRSMSDIKQGVTLEVFGEGNSMGPEVNKNPETGVVTTITLKQKLDALAKKGVSTNIASFVGATTLRKNTVGYDDRAATPEELMEMKAMVKQAMEEGAVGIGSALIYAPAFYSSTEELIEISKVAAEYDGLYISHMRSEGVNFLQSTDELIRIADEAGIRAEVHHLKQSGKDNWPKLDLFINKVDSAQNAGLAITGNMYTYVAASTGLSAAMPPWVQEGGYKKWSERLQDPKTRKEVLKAMREPAREWESLMQGAGSADNMILVGFKNDSLKYLSGKTLQEVAEMRKSSPEDTAIDLVIQDGSRVQVIYFVMDEENVRRQVALPWVSFGSDGGSYAAEGDRIKRSTHPRSYGNFARLFAKYVREENVISLEEAVRKSTSLPASNLRIKKRGKLQEGYFADIAIFDFDKIQDNATFTDPHQYSSGMIHVIVNGTQVLKNGEHTGEMPGRVVHGPGYVE